MKLVMATLILAVLAGCVTRPMTPEEEAAYAGCDNAPVFTLGEQNRRDWAHCRERSRSTTTECTTIFGLTSCTSR